MYYYEYYDLKDFDIIIISPKYVLFDDVVVDT